MATQKTEPKVSDTPFEASIDNASGGQEPPYVEKQSEYRKFVLQRLEQARVRRESPQVFYNSMTYTENYRTNMLAANSYTPPRANAEDTQVVTGTTREKVLAIVSTILNLDFMTTFKAFDDDDMEDELVGESMTDLVHRSNIIERWDEKKLAAYFEMATQGDVYIQDVYVEEVLAGKKKVALASVTDKMMTDPDFHKSEQPETVFAGCKRVLIPGTQVYKGSMTTLEFRDQPYVAVRMVKPYEYTKAMYGRLPWFKYVPRSLKVVTTETTDQYGINWRLEPITDNLCEIIIYEDRPNREYNIMINGVMMLPAGFGFPWNHDEYDIVQGGLEPISAYFSEHKSIPAKTKLDQEVLDETLRLLVLKNQKSFAPPIANYSSNILSRSMFLPGKVNNGLNKGEVEVLGGDPSQYAIQPGEFSMFQLLKKNIDDKSIASVLQGQDQGSGSATESNNTMQQAKQQLGVIVFGFMKLHQDLDYLRLLMALDNYTRETGTVANETRDGVEAKYRSFSIQKDVGGKGMGVKKIQFTENHSKPMDLYNQENGITPNENGGAPDVSPPKNPVRIMQISPSALRSIKFTWYAEVVPSERETSMATRIGYEDRIAKAMELFGPQAVNVPYAQQIWAVKNKIDPNLFFNKPQAPPLPGAAPTDQPDQNPKANESNMQKQMRPFGGGKGPAEAQRQGVNG